MRGAWTIALREIVERRMVLVAALVAGLFPFASPLLPGVPSGDWVVARDLGALVVGVSFGLGCAVLLGASVIARDLAERRLSFDFSRPVGSGGIWAGRLGGALGLSILALGVALLPVTVVGGGLLSTSNGEGLRGVALAAVAGMIVLVPLAHVVGVALRSRSGWLAVDLAAAAVVSLLVAATGRVLYDAFAIQLLNRLAIVLGVLVVPALWIASAAQVALGRTDPRRGHAAQACTLWGALLGVALLFAGFVTWVAAATPRDLSWVQARPAPRGSWVAVTGESRGRGDYMPLFLIDATTGRHVKLGTSPAIEDGSLFKAIRFSSDGRRAVVFHVESPGDLRTQVSVVDLDGGAGTIRDTNIVLPRAWGRVVLSDDGARLAVLDEGMLSVLDLDSGATLAAVREPEPKGWNSVSLLFFVSERRVRIVTVGERVSIDELDVAMRKLERRSTLAAWGEDVAVKWDAPRDRYLVEHWRSHEDALLADGRTGARLRDLTCGARGGCRWRFLADGRIVGTELGSQENALHLLSVDGDEIRKFKPPVEGSASFLRELEPGKLVVTASSVDGLNVLHTEAYILDLTTGSWDRLPGELDPSIARDQWWPLLSPDAGSVGAHLFLSKGALVLYDPKTKTRRVLAGRE